jgi:hypothetical protein
MDKELLYMRIKGWDIKDIFKKDYLVVRGNRYIKMVQFIKVILKMV